LGKNKQRDLSGQRNVSKKIEIIMEKRGPMRGGTSNPISLGNSTRRGKPDFLNFKEKQRA